MKNKEELNYNSRLSAWSDEESHAVQKMEPSLNMQAQNENESQKKTKLQS